MITDAQVHVWLAESPQRPWEPGGRGYAHRPEHTTGELLSAMDDAGIDRAVLVPPAWEGDRNDYSLKAANAHPDRLVVMGRVTLTEPMTTAALVQLAGQLGMVGVRLTFTRGASRHWLEDGTADWFWPRAEQAGLPVAVYAPGQLGRIAEIAARHPGLRLAIDHAGLPIGLQPGELDAAVTQAAALAAMPNVAVKISSLPNYVAESYPFTSIHEAVRRLVGQYGPERVFWGSDLTRLRCSYAESAGLVMEALTFLSGDDRRLIMGDAIARWLPWPESPS
jgi:predicted TIM-barrel fold metal-dependent hydrolase